MRPTTIALITIFILVTAHLCAQPNPSASDSSAGDSGPPVTRELSCCFLFAPSVPDIYFRDSDGAYQRLRIDRVRFSSWNTIPLGPELVLYREGTNAEGARIMVPRQRIALPEGTGPLRLLFYYREGGGVGEYLFSDEAGLHGALQVRVLNLTGERVGLSVGSENAILRAGEGRIFGPVDQTGTRFTFRYGYDRDDLPTLVSPTRRLRFIRDNQRLTIIFAYRPTIFTETRDDGSTVESPGFELDAMRFYDYLPSQES